MILEVLEDTIIHDQGEVSREAFESWVDENCKRGFDTERGEHPGLHTWDDYYSKYASGDLKEYLAVRTGGGKLRRLPDLSQMLKKMIND